MPMDLLVFENRESGSKYVAQILANRILMDKSVNEESVIGLATGNTPKALYKELVNMYQQGVSFYNVCTFNLDEYYPMNHASPQSYHSYMDKQLFNHIDIQEENTFIPSGEVSELDLESSCQNFEDEILRRGGIDVQILGLGLNGHIGFNEPRSARYSSTRKVKLTLTTRKAAEKYFGGLDKVPEYAITMGMNTILNAEEIIVMAWGKKKAAIVEKCVNGAVDANVPGSYLQNHENVKMILDKESAALLKEEQKNIMETKVS